jgi:L-rhamnose isomerase
LDVSISKRNISRTKMNTKIKEAYELARKQYAKYGIDIDVVLNKLKDIPISI